VSDPRIGSNPNDVIVDYLKDIRDELKALNRKLDAMTAKPENHYGGDDGNR
jgi:hypothetical protein